MTTEPGTTEPVTTEPRRAFYVDETMHTPHGYVPALVVEDEPGFYPMIGSGEFSQPWYWGDDIVVAKRIAAEANEKLGLSEEDARNIVVSSMRAAIKEDAARASRAERYERVRRGLPTDVQQGFSNR